MYTKSPKKSWAILIVVVAVLATGVFFIGVWVPLHLLPILGGG